MTVQLTLRYHCRNLSMIVLNKLRVKNTDLYIFCRCTYHTNSYVFVDTESVGSRRNRLNISVWRVLTS